ncbi:MAG TPA: anti-sigma factor [Chthonomonadaceae bacterium]|nr:anti-sigma factor [Chthonomonadaceae bacterium]
MTQVDRLTCAEVFRRLDDYLDRELSPREMQLVKAHLEICAACASEYAFEAEVLNQVRAKVQRIDLPSGLLAKVSRALAAAADEP